MEMIYLLDVILSLGVGAFLGFGASVAAFFFFRRAAPRPVHGRVSGRRLATVTCMGSAALCGAAAAFHGGIPPLTALVVIPHLMAFGELDRTSRWAPVPTQVIIVLLAALYRFETDFLAVSALVVATLLVTEALFRIQAAFGRVHMPPADLVAFALPFLMFEDVALAGAVFVAFVAVAIGFRRNAAVMAVLAPEDTGLSAGGSFRHDVKTVDIPFLAWIYPITAIVVVFDQWSL